jgi:hypothetical protein
MRRRRRRSRQWRRVRPPVRPTGPTRKLAMWATPPAAWEPSAASSLRCLPSQLEEAEIDCPLIFVARRHQLCNRGVARTPKDTNLNRAGAVVRRLLLWCFRNRETGAITVAQTPNLALSAFLVATAILWLMHPNVTISTAAKVVATGSLIVWALDEVVRGVNPWRRFLGVAVLIYVVSTVRL